MQTVKTAAFIGIYLGRGRPSRSQVFTLELFPGWRFPGWRPYGPNQPNALFYRATIGA
jgi:hypothetical protein